MGNFYRDIWKKRFHILAPLSKQQQDTFDKAKRMLLERKAILNYPDVSKPFDLYTDANDV